MKYLCMIKNLKFRLGALGSKFCGIYGSFVAH